MAAPALLFPLFSPPITFALHGVASVWALVANIAARRYPLRRRVRSLATFPLLVLIGLAALASSQSD
jgi:hypothetical protein